MDIKDDKKDDWKKYVEGNTDLYGGAVIRYTERWADLMEIRIDKGEEIKDIAKETSHEADINGITGFMYGYAVGILSRVWKHGEELRQWHNRDSQIRDEGEKANKDGGVLNPSVISVK